MALLLAIGLPILAHAGLLWSFDLAARLPAFYLWAAIGFVGVFLAERYLTDAKQADRESTNRRSIATIVLGVALVLRVLLLPLSLSLSNDAYRYVWDGRVLLNAANPYELSPDAAALEPLRDDLWRAMDHRDVPTVYPPVALTAFSIAAATPKPLLAWKALLVVADLLTCWLLLKLCILRQVPATRAVWYAWNPLVTLEIAGMGHVDGLGVLLAVAAVVALTARSKVERLPESEHSPTAEPSLSAKEPPDGGTPRWQLAALAAAGAVLVKLVPLVVVPLWARASRRPIVFLAATGILVAGAVAPVVLSVGGVPPGLLEFGVSWEFNGPLYEPLWRQLERIDSRQIVEQRLDSYKVERGDHEFWNRFYPYNYPQLHAKLLLAAVLGLVWAILLAYTRDPLVGMGKLFAALLLCSSTVYPWYLLWLLPWAALCRSWTWRLMSASILLVYVPQFTTAELFPRWQLLAWAPLVLIVLSNRWFAVTLKEADL